MPCSYGSQTLRKGHGRLFLGVSYGTQQTCSCEADTGERLPAPEDRGVDELNYARQECTSGSKAPISGQLQEFARILMVVIRVGIQPSNKYMFSRTCMLVLWSAAVHTSAAANRIAC